MNKLLSPILCAAIIFAGYGYNGSTTAPVILSGGIIKAKHVEENHKKYKRKDCPVCKGKGYYISGDGIQKIICTYCEPETQDTKPKTIILRK